MAESSADKQGFGSLRPAAWGASFVLCLAVLMVAGAAGVLAIGGCQKALFSPDEERSPYDRYDSIRGQRAPTYNEDEYGRRKPNVRGRLLTND